MIINNSVEIRLNQNENCGSIKIMVRQNIEFLIRSIYCYLFILKKIMCLLSFTMNFNNTHSIVLSDNDKSTVAILYIFKLLKYEENL